MVSLCALCAMERGRCAGWRWLLEGKEPGLALVPALQRCAVARFWELLADFCAVDAAPAVWQIELCRPHPFIQYDCRSATWRVRRA